MVMVEKKNEELTMKVLPEPQQQQQVNRDSYNDNINDTVKQNYDDDSLDDHEDEDYDENDEDQSASKRSRSNNNETLIVNNKKEDQQQQHQNNKLDDYQNHENLLLLKKAYTNKYVPTDDVQSSLYAPISPALTNNSDKSPLHHHNHNHNHHDLMLMHHFNEDHGLSLSALSSSSSSSLIRTSSNASSSSSTSSNPTGSDQMLLNSQNDLNSQFLMPTPNQLMMFNENFKKLISTSAPTSTESFLNDQLALMVRSRSSSAESSASSSAASSYQMKNLFQMHQNLRTNSEFDNVLLSKYLNSVTRAYNNQKKIQSPQQVNYLYNANNTPNQEAIVNDLLLKQVSNNKLSKIDENFTDGTKTLPNITNQMSVMKQMLNQYNIMPNFSQQSKDQEVLQNNTSNSILQQIPKLDNNDKNPLESVTSTSLNNTQPTENDIKNDELKAKLNAVVNKVSSNNIQSSSSLCKVCGDEASGFHYGVDSCEGCKGFFRRCITQGMNHQCTNNQQCEITPFSRNSCQFCRLKKCFAVGMSREASRLGRRPKRPRDESNLNNQSINGKNVDDETNNENNKSINEPTTKFDQQDIEINQKQVNIKKENVIESPKTIKTTLQKYNNKETPIKNNPLMDLSSISTSLNSIPQPPFNLDNKTPDEKLNNDNELPNEDEETQKQQQQQKIEINKLNKQDSNGSLKNLELNKANQPIDVSTFLSLIEIADEYLSYERAQQLEYIRCTIIETYCVLWPTTQDKIQLKLKDCAPILKPKNVQLNKETSQWDDAIEVIVPMIMDVLKCSKYIPGFVELQHHDQYQLLKQGSFEPLCVNLFNFTDSERKLMLSPDLKYLMDSSDIKSMALGFFISDVFELSLKISNLKLTDDEIALFNALLIINPNRESLVDRKKVNELQATLMHVLYRHMRKYRPDDDEIFTKLLKLIPVLSNLNNKHSDAINKLHTNSSKETKSTEASQNID